MGQTSSDGTASPQRAPEEREPPSRDGGEECELLRRHGDTVHGLAGDVGHHRGAHGNGDGAKLRDDRGVSSEQTPCGVGFRV